MHSARWILLVVVHFTILHPTQGQKPSLDAKTLQKGESFRTNFCERHNEVENGTTEMRHALKGLNINPALYENQINTATGGIDEANPGIAVKMMDEIARRAEFTWRDSYGLVEPPNPNQTWTDVLVWSIEKFDLNGEWYLRTTKRLADGILFPEGWYDGSLILVRKREEVDGSFRWHTFLTPFTVGVWCLIFATTAISGVVYYMIEYMECDGDRNNMEASLNESVYLAALTLTGHSLFNPKRTGNRIVLFSTCFLFLIVVASYTANLAIFLVIRSTPGLVINDIQDVIKNDLRLCVLRGGAADTFMMDQYPTAKLVGVENITGTYLAVDNGECDLVLSTMGTWETNKLDISTNKDCRKEWVGRVVQLNDAGFSIRDSAQLCSSLLRDVISLHLLEMKLDKTYDRVWDIHREKSTTNDCKVTKDVEDDFSERMNVENLGGIFIVHAIALVFSLALTVYMTYQREHCDKPEGNVPNHQFESVPGTRRDPESSNDDNPSVTSSVSQQSELLTLEKQREYMESMNKQMEFMESMKKQMDVMQEQLEKLTEDRPIFGK